MLTDLVSYWRNIIGILNVLCPRPSQEEDSIVDDFVSSSAKLSNTSSFPLAYNAQASPSKRGGTTPSLKRKKKDETADGASATKDMTASSSKFVKKFLGMFSSTKDGDEAAAEKENKKRRPDKRSKSVKEAQDEVQERTAFIDQNSKDHNTVKIPSLYVFDYGKPKYGLSGASWTLLVLARMAIEDVILRLGLNPAIILTQPTVKVDTQLLHDLGGSIGINGGIAEGDSEDEYSVSQYHGADSDGSVDLGMGLDASSVTSVDLGGASAGCGANTSTGKHATDSEVRKFGTATLPNSGRTSKPTTTYSTSTKTSAPDASGGGLQITVPTDEVVPAGKLHMPKKSGSPLAFKIGGLVV